MTGLQQSWRYKMGRLGLDFADAVQIYPRQGHKNIGGKVPPSTTETTDQEKTIMDPTTSTNGERTAPKDFTNIGADELAKLISELKDEMKNSKKVSARALDAAVITLAVSAGIGLAVFVSKMGTSTPVAA